MKNVKILLLSAALLLGVFGTFACTSTTANQDAVPHDMTQKVISELGITPEQFNGVEGITEDSTLTITEYYSEADDDFVLDDFMMMTTFPLSDKDYSADIFEKYSVVTYNKTSNFLFEIIIFKLPLTNGKADADALTDAQKLCQAKLDDTKDYIDKYAPANLTYANKASVTTVNNYVYYVIAEDYAKAEQIIKDALETK